MSRAWSSVCMDPVSSRCRSNQRSLQPIFKCPTHRSFSTTAKKPLAKLWRYLISILGRILHSQCQLDHLMSSLVTFS